MKDFNKILDQLKEPQISSKTLSRLSNLLEEDLARFTQTWAAFPAERRRDIMARLVEIAEADVEADFTPIFTLGLQDGDPRVRTSAIEGLWENEDCQLIRPLARMLQEDESLLVREAAATSLSRFALLSELEKLPSRFVDLVWTALWDTVHNEGEDLDVRRRALESLAYFGRPEIRQIIANAYQHDEPHMRASAVFAMGRSGDESWDEIVQQELDSQDPEMRFEAVRACGALQLSDTVHILGRLVADPDPEVKLMAVWSLGQIGGTEARRVLEICYEQGDEALQDAADEALAEIDFMQGSLDWSMYDFGQDDVDDEGDEENE